MRKMIEILPQNGSHTFRQWDENRKLQVLDEAVTQVHFANANAGQALVCPVYEWEGLRVADVPNILLQEALELGVFPVATDAQGRVTVGKEEIPVLAREQPQDYVYTETQVLSYSALVEQIHTLEQSSVMSVNGAAPDETGNVQLVIPHPAQPDWNAAEGEPGHILGRTHWVEGGRVEVLPETTFSKSNTSINHYRHKEPFGLIPGQTYIVNWEGAQYRCTAVNYSVAGYHVTLLGDYSANLPDAPATGEPFGIMECDVLTAANFGAALVQILPNGKDPMATYDFTIGIRQITETVHKLPTKFLPDGVPYCIDGGRVEIPVTASWADDDGDGVNDTGYIRTPVGLVVGQTYTVKWNGVEYEVTGLDVNALSGGELPGVGIGNPLILGGEDTGEPFAIVDVGVDISDGGGIYGMIASVNNTIDENFVIYQDYAAVQKLNPKCLPGSVAHITEKREAVLAEYTEVSTNGTYFVRNSTDMVLTIGETYAVNWNGVEYIVTAVDAEVYNPDAKGSALLTNDVAGIKSGNYGNLVFMILKQPGDIMVIQGNVLNLTVSIHHITPEYHKLDEGLLPESVDGIVVRSSTADSTKKFKITVDDSGTITATEV